jgi:hypothetical protein
MKEVEGLLRLNMLGKSHLGKEYLHGYVMTDVDDTRFVAFRLKGAARYCNTCRRLMFMAQKLVTKGVLTSAQFNELVWLLNHPEDDNFGRGSSKP